jgi:hypothetical protein
VLLTVWYLYVFLKTYSMNSVIGIYEDHDAALSAIAQLHDKGYPVAQMTIMGLTETEVVDNELHVMQKNPIKVAGLGTGVALGTTVGILTGVGLFAIPGLGVLFGAGALVGAIAGFDFGLIGGGIASVLASVGVKDEIAEKYDTLLKAGKFLVVANGSKEEVANAKKHLHEHNSSSELNVY